MCELPFLQSRTVYNTKGTRAHTHRELIREWLWEPKGSSQSQLTSTPRFLFFFTAPAGPAFCRPAASHAPNLSFRTLETYRPELMCDTRKWKGEFKLI